MSDKNGTLQVLEFPSNPENQGVYKIYKDAKLIYVSFENFVPSFVGYTLILPSKNNIGKKNFKQNFIKAKAYFKNKKRENIYDVIDFKTGKDKKSWTGSLIGDKSFIKICKNCVKDSGEDKNFYQVIYVTYPEETKQVIEEFVKKNKNSTVLEFVNSREYKVLQQFAERNAKKCLFDFSCRMLFNVSNDIDIKYKHDSNVERPHKVKLQSKWFLNSFQMYNNDLYLFKNCLSVNNKGELLKINDRIEVPYVDVPEKERNELKAFQIFDKQNHIYFIEKEGKIDIKPKKAYSNSVKSIKILIPQMFIIQ